MQKIKSKFNETDQTVKTKMSNLIRINKLKNDSFVKLKNLNYTTLCPNNFE